MEKLNIGEPRRLPSTSLILYYPDMFITTDPGFFDDGTFAIGELFSVDDTVYRVKDLKIGRVMGEYYLGVKVGIVSRK